MTTNNAPGLCLDSGEFVPASELAAAKLKAKAPPSEITASIMRDDGGERPVFCLMVAYLSEADAIAALGLLSASKKGSTA